MSVEVLSVSTHSVLCIVGVPPTEKNVNPNGQSANKAHCLLLRLLYAAQEGHALHPLSLYCDAFLRLLGSTSR